MRLTWSPEAIADLGNIYDYVAADHPGAADRLVSGIIQSVESLLSEHERAGRPGRAAGTRELVVVRTRYVVLYRLREDDVFILRVYHGARNRPRTR